MTTRLIILNGASSTGKSGIARCLQAILPDPWLTLGVDDLIHAMPRPLTRSVAGIEVSGDGVITIGQVFRDLEVAWRRGVAEMAGAGARVIVDDVFLGGGASQQRWREATADLEVLWVAVRCDPVAGVGREIARADRVAGQHVSQAAIVHLGVDYDLEVDTTHAESMECATTIAARVK